MPTAIAALLAASTTKKSSGSFTFLFIIIAAYGLLYFFYIRPRTRKARAAKAGAQGYQVGDEVMTVGGMIATVIAMDDRTVTLRTESGHEMRFVKEAIKQRYVEPSAEPEPETEPPADDDADGPSH